MAAKKQYVAKAALVIAKDEQDRDIYIYEGSPVPDNVTKESVERLLAEDFIAAVDAPPTDEEKAEQEKAAADLKAANDKVAADAKAEAAKVAADKKAADAKAAADAAAK